MIVGPIIFFLEEQWALFYLILLNLLELFEHLPQKSSLILPLPHLIYIDNCFSWAE